MPYLNGYGIMNAPSPEAARRGQMCLLEIYFFLNIAFKLRYGHANLSHGIPVAYGDSLVLKGIEGVPISSCLR